MLYFERDKRRIYMLKDLKVAELRKVADEFGVEYPPKESKVLLIARLAEEGVTEESYARFAEAEDVTEQEVAAIPVKASYKKATPAEDEILVYMQRENGTYETFGHKFTKEHPFIAMSPKDAQEIFDNEVGFHVATPAQVQEYYS
jgi:isopentenyldiphosphate isomerase